MGATQTYAAINALKGGASDLVALSSGDNTITPPSTCDYVIIELDPQSAIAINLKRITTDTGFRLNRLASTFICFDPGAVTTFQLEAVSGTANIWIRYGRLH